MTFVLGAEREGLPEELVAQSHHVATIGLPGAAESLTVAVAGGSRLRAPPAGPAREKSALRGLADPARHRSAGELG